jgi:hypothetical protein
VLLIESPGIVAVEERSRLYRGLIQEVGYPEEYGSALLSVEQNEEMALRYIMRGEFAGILGGDESATDLKLLEAVLFDIVYPTRT